MKRPRRMFFTRLFQRITGGRPMIPIESFFHVGDKAIWKCIDGYGRYWIAEGPWSWFRVKAPDEACESPPQPVAILVESVTVVGIQSDINECSFCHSELWSGKYSITAQLNVGKAARSGMVYCHGCAEQIVDTINNRMQRS